MEWENAVALEDGGYKIPSRWLKLHYYEALNTLFRVENALRIFVYAILKNEMQEKWGLLSITSDDAEQGTIESIAKKRRAQTDRFGYLGHPILCPIMYLTSGELIGIITSEAYWKHFSRFFPGSKEIMKNKLEEIGVVRNSLAHFRPLKQDDVEVVKQNAKQVLMSIEKYLSQMLHCNINIPSNTVDPWYKELGVYGNDYCKLQFKQSKDEQWFQLSLSYKSPSVVTHKSSDRYVAYSALNLISPAILKHHPELTKLITCCSETVTGRAKKSDGSLNIQKRVSYVFRRVVLEKQYKIVGDVLHGLLHEIAAETELITEDNLARGKYIESVSLSVFFKDNSYDTQFIDTSTLQCAMKEGDPMEYWGGPGYVPLDFVSQVRRYPWMTVDISNEDPDLPF